MGQQHLISPLREDVGCRCLIRPAKQNGPRRFALYPPHKALMPKESKVPLQDLAKQFFATPDIYLPSLSPEPICPGTDLAYIEELNMFFLRRSSPAHHWAPLPHSEYSNTPTLQRLILAFMASAYPSYALSPQSLNDFIKLLRLLAPLIFEKTSSAHTIAFTDNVSYDYDRKTLTPTNPTDDFTLLALNFPSTAINTPTPLFDQFLAHAFPKDTKAFETYIYEVIGYLLLPPYLAQNPACFYLYGETGSGKSVFLDIIEAIFPDYLKSALSLSDLTGSQFRIAGLAGKLINIVDEDESEYVNGGRLKALTSMRPITAERKYENAFRFTPQAKFIFGSNQLPTIKNPDSAIERRLHLIGFEHRVAKDKIIRNLAELIVTQELAGIVGKALYHSALFLKNNLEFSMPEKLINTRAEFMVETSSPLAFFEECYQVSDTQSTSNHQIYEDYLLYCRKCNRLPVSSIKLHVALNQIPGLITTRTTTKRFKNCAKRLDAPTLNV